MSAVCKMWAGVVAAYCRRWTSLLQAAKDNSTVGIISIIRAGSVEIPRQLPQKHLHKILYKGRSIPFARAFALGRFTWNIFFRVREHGEEYIRWLMNEKRLAGYLPGYLEIARGNREIINKYRHNRICVNIAVANGYWDYYDVPLHAGEWERVLVSAIRCGVDPLTRLQLVQRGLLQHRFIFSYKDLRVFPEGTVANLSMTYVKTFHGVLICENIAFDLINCGTVVSSDGKRIKKTGSLRPWEALYIAVKTGNTQWLVAPEKTTTIYRYVMPSSTARAIEKAGLLIQCIFGDFYEIWTD